MINVCVVKSHASKFLSIIYSVIVLAVVLFITAGFDFEGGHFVAMFATNSTIATVDIPIIEDQNSEEEVEYFLVQLSLRSHRIMPALPYHPFSGWQVCHKPEFTFKMRLFWTFQAIA